MDWFNADKDLLLSQVKRGLNFYNLATKVIPQKSGYDLLVAHETFCSGMAGAYLAHNLNIHTRILDIVEYPDFSQRSTDSIRTHGRLNPLSTILTARFGVSIADNYDYIYATSQGQIQFMQNAGLKSNIKLLRNCRTSQDITSNHILRDDYNIKHNDIVILFANRAYRHTGLEIALRGLAKLDDRYKLVLLGEIAPELENEVSNIVAENNLGNRFIVTGMLDPSYIIPAMSRADIVLTMLEPQNDNHKHSLPNRVFDAIMARVPVIAIDGTELGEFVKTNDIGVTFNSSEPLGFVTSVDAIIRKMKYYKSNLNAKAQLYCWEKEEARLLTDILALPRVPRRCLFLANKDVRRNDRVKRILQSLIKCNISTDVVTLYKPFDSMLVDAVNYYAIR